MGTADNAKRIWDYLKNKGLNDYAVAGIMGNLKAESDLNPKNLQNRSEKRLGLTDNEYTEAVDNGTYTDFASDNAGYGLAQWTYCSRKQNLLDLAKSRNKSVGDLETQLDFLWKELQGFKTVIATLRNATSILEASNIILRDYERATNQTESNQNSRATLGAEYYGKYAENEKETPQCDEPQPECPTRAEETPCETYVVKQGDTLWGIAKKYLGSGYKWPKIAELNGISGTLIRIGQVLQIPKR